MNQKRYKYYEEIAKQKGKQLFIEECSFSTSDPNVKLMEKVFLVEDTTGNKYEAVGIIKNVPISKYTENANGRIYSEQLWQEVKKKKMGEGSLCMANHPEDDMDDVTNIVGVWHNMQLHEDHVSMDLYLVEDKPLKILKVGGALGTSSVGYGTLSESDGKTVEPSSFELDRAADWVYRPSQGTYATFENISESITKTDKDNILTESKTNKLIEQENVSEKENNKRKEQIMLDKIKEAEYKDKTRSVIKIAKSSAKLSEAIEDLKSFKGTVPEELTECHERIESTINDLAVKLEEQVENTHKSLKEKESTLEEVSAKYATLEKAHNQLKEDYNKVKSLVEKTQSSDMKKMLEDIEQFAKDRKLMEADIAIFEEEVAKRDADIKIFIKERKDMLEDIAVFKKELKKYKEAVGKCKAGKKIKEDENEDYSEIDGLGDSDPLDADFPAPEEDVLDIDLESGEVLDAEDTLEGVDGLGLDDDLDAEALINEEEELESQELAGDDEEPTITHDADPSAELTEEEDEDSKEDEKEDAEEEKEKEKKEESTKIKVRKDVFKHYKEMVTKTPALADVRKEILTSKTLYEAVRKIEKFTEARKAKEELITLRESSPFKVQATEKKYVFKRD